MYGSNCLELLFNNISGVEFGFKFKFSIFIWESLFVEDNNSLSFEKIVISLNIFTLLILLFSTKKIDQVLVFSYKKIILFIYI